MPIEVVTIVDPSAIKPPGRIAVSRFDPRQRPGRIVAPIHGAITSRAPAPQLLHDDPQRSRRDAPDAAPGVAAAPEPVVVEANAAAPSILAAVPAFVVSAELLLMAAQMLPHASSAHLDVYSPASLDEAVRPHTDIEV